MTSLTLKAPLPTEGDECVCLLQWARVKHYQRWCLADLLIMIPNGTKLFGTPKERAMQMARMKRLGFKPGAADYLLPIAAQGKHGLFIEVKRRQLSVVSDEQHAFAQTMIELGYAAVIVKGWEAARLAIEEYLK